MSPISRTLIRGKAKNLVLTERDKTILRYLYARRFLTTDHIQWLTDSKSRTKLNYRLKDLFDARFLDRPPIQEQIFSHANKRPLVHALGNKGIQYIKETMGFKVPQSVDWTDKNRKVKSKDFLEHVLGVSDFFVSAELTTADLDGIRFVSEDVVIAQSPGRTAALPYPLRLPTGFDWLDGTFVQRSTVPDGMFALTDSRSDGEPRKSFYFLEYDTGSMPVVRSSINQSSIIKKMFGYADIYGRKLHVKRFGYRNFRVLFVTRGKDRIQSMIDAYEQHVRDLCPPGAFLFADYDALMSRSPFGDVWVNGIGQPAVFVPEL